VHLAIPVGYCPLDDHFESDRKILYTLGNFVADSLNILLIFIRCDQLDLFRNGDAPSIADYGIYMTSKPPGIFQAAQRENYLSGIEEKIQSSWTPEANMQTLNVLKQHGIDISPESFKGGLLPRDNKAVYVGFAVNQPPVVLACVAGFTLVSDLEVATY